MLKILECGFQTCARLNGQDIRTASNLCQDDWSQRQDVRTASYVCQVKWS